MRSPRRWWQIVCGAAVLMAAVVTTSAQGGRAAQAPAADSLIPQVRAALGHGQPDEAARLIAASRATASTREFASALVEIYQGKDEAARARLAPLAKTTPLGDPALELALLDIRHGRRADGMAVVNAMCDVRTFNGPDDYLRLMRAARAYGEFQLAFDAYQRVENLPRPDIHTEQGDAFLEFHKPGDAAAAYRKALEADAAWVPAHVGLARAFADDDPKVAETEFGAAKKLAPSDPRVLLLAAERAVGDEDWAGAVRALDALGAAVPGTVEESALRAAVAYADHRPNDIEPAIAKEHAANPVSARGYWLTGELAAQAYHFDDATAFARKAVAVDPDDPHAQLDLGLFLLRTGDEKTARLALEAAWKAEKHNHEVLTKNLLDMLDHLDAFDVVPDGNLIFKFDKAEAPVMKLYALKLGEEAYKTFVDHYGITPQGPILVEIFPRHDDFAVRTVGLPGIVGALGACFGRVVSMDSPHARPPDEFSWQATEWHELAHVFTLQLSKYNVPRWLTEGLSVFEEHRRNPAWGREAALTYAAHLSLGKTFGVSGIGPAFKDPANYTLAYFEASLIVEHLFNLKGDAGIRALLQAYADGADDEKAFQAAYGQSRAQIDASFRQFATKEYGALAAAMKPPAEPVRIDLGDVEAVRRLAAASPNSYEPQLALGAALIKAGDDKAAQPVLRRAAELAPQAGGKESPHMFLAQIAARAGDKETERRELRSLLQFDHDDVTVARQLAALSTDPAAADDRDFALHLVTALDPFDADAHTQLGGREMALKNYADALVEFEAVLAGKPRNVAEAHTDAGEALLALGRKDEAKRHALLALQEAPTFARAQDLLLAAMGK